MSFWCRLGWHDWAMWSEVQITMDDDSEAVGLKRRCWCCGMIQVREVKKQ